MAAVVVDIVSALLAVFQSADAAADARFAVVVLAQVLRVGQHRLEELQRHNLHLHLHLLIGGSGERSLVFNLVDARHTQVLDAVEVGEILLAEGHPEAGALDCGVVLHERLNLLVVEQIALLGAHVGVGQRLVYLQRRGLHPFAVFPVKSLLRNLADVDFGVEVGGESLVVVAGVAVYYVEILYLVEVVLRGVGGEHARHARVEAAAQDCREARVLKAFLVSPLPAVFKVRLVLGFVVGGVEIVHPACQARLHYGEVLIGQGEVHAQLRLVVVEESLQLLHVVGVHLRRLDVGVADILLDLVAFRVCAARYHDVGEDISVLGDFHGCHGCHAARSDN